MKSERFVIAFDSHGDMIDPDAHRAFREFVKHWKPTIRIHGGDAFDLRALRGGASKDERCESMQADVSAGIDFLQWFDPQVFIMGNHDDRLPQAMTGRADGAIRQLASMLWDQIADSIPNTQIIPYDKEKYYQLGQFKVIHGFHSGVYAARQSAQSYGNVIMGHVHSFSQQTIDHIDGVMGITSGCLCRRSMSYNKRHVKTLRQENGWIYGVKYGKTIIVWQARRIEGRWIFPSEMREINEQGKRDRKSA